MTKAALFYKDKPTTLQVGDIIVFLRPGMLKIKRNRENLRTIKGDDKIFISYMNIDLFLDIVQLLAATHLLGFEEVSGQTEGKKAYKFVKMTK